MLHSPAPPAACRCGCPAGTHWMISILSGKRAARNAASDTPNWPVTISGRIGVMHTLLYGGKPATTQKIKWKKRWSWITASSCIHRGVKKKQSNRWKPLRGLLLLWGIQWNQAEIIRKCRISFLVNDFFNNCDKMILTIFCLIVILYYDERLTVRLSNQLKERFIPWKK